MKKNLKNLCLLTIILTILSLTVILIGGKTYTTYFLLNNKDNYELKVENASGEIEILEEKEENNKYIVKVKSKKTRTGFYISKLRWRIQRRKTTIYP